MKPDQQRVCDIVMDTVVKVCASGLNGSTARVQGVIAVTVDDSDVFVIHINDTICHMTPSSHVHNLQHLSPAARSPVARSPVALSMLSPVAVSKSSPAAVSMSSPACSSARKRARHRLVFQSPDVSRHRRSELADSEEPGILPGGLSCNKASQRSTYQYSSMRQIEPVNKTAAVDNKTVTAGPSVVIVDSDDEDSKPVVSKRTAVMPKHAVCCESFMNVTDTKNCAETARSYDTMVAANTVKGADTMAGADTVRGADTMAGADTVRGADTMAGADTVRGADTTAGADTVSSLCIADVVGSVAGWCNTSAPLTVDRSETVKNDFSSYQDDNNNNDDDDDDEVAVMEEDYDETSQLLAKATPPRHFQVTFNAHRIDLIPGLISSAVFRLLLLIYQTNCIFGVSKFLVYVPNNHLSKLSYFKNNQANAVFLNL